MCSPSSHYCAFVPDVLSALELSSSFLLKYLFLSKAVFYHLMWKMTKHASWQALISLTYVVLYFHLNVCAKDRLFLFVCFHYVIIRDCVYCVIWKIFVAWMNEEWNQLLPCIMLFWPLISNSRSSVKFWATFLVLDPFVWSLCCSLLIDSDTISYFWLHLLIVILFPFLDSFFTSFLWSQTLYYSINTVT